METAFKTSNQTDGQLPRKEPRDQDSENGKRHVSRSSGQCRKPTKRETGNTRLCPMPCSLFPCSSARRTVAEPTESSTKTPSAWAYAACGDGWEQMDLSLWPSSTICHFRRIVGLRMSVDHRPYHWYPPAPKELTPAFRMGQGDSPELRGTPPLKEEYKCEIAPALAMTLFIRRGFGGGHWESHRPRSRTGLPVPRSPMATIHSDILCGGPHARGASCHSDVAPP